MQKCSYKRYLYYFQYALRNTCQKLKKHNTVCMSIKPGLTIITCCKTSAYMCQHTTFLLYTPSITLLKYYLLKIYDEKVQSTFHYN